MTSSAFITGGSGFVGSRLIEMLIAQGWSVRGLARSDAAQRIVGSLGATPVRADIGDSDSLAQCMRGCEVVFHAAAHFKLWGDYALFDKVNVQGTAALLRAAAQASVQRFVQVGASAVVMGAPAALENIDESLPLQMPAWAPYSASKARAEQLVIAANRPKGMRTSVIRPPLIWGRGMPMLEQMRITVEKGQFRWPGSGSQPMSTAQVDNVCSALILAAERSPGGHSYFITDERTSTLREVISALLATQGVAAPTGTVPFSVAWQLARVMETAWRILPISGEPPMTRQMLRMIALPFTLSTQRAREELGYVPRVSWDSGLSQMQSLSAMTNSNRPHLQGA